jgi:hypothetical protein
MAEEHVPLRHRLGALAGHHDAHSEPSFETSRDATLAGFGRLFVESGLWSFDANKHLRTDALSPIYDCETESRASAHSEPDLFVAIWTPVWENTDPVTGFRTGQDSALLGSTATVAMPQDERTAALLMLVTTTFVHLSGGYENGVPVVRGAVETDDNGYRFLQLDAALVPAPGHDGTDTERARRVGDAAGP